MKGKQKISFEELLFNTDDVMKMDIIQVLDDGLLAEITDVYQIQLNQKKNFKNEDTSQKDISNDILDFETEGNYFKVAKRIFSLLLRDERKYKPFIKKFIDFFNSQAGLLYNIEYYYGLIDLLQKQKFKPVPKSLIQFNLKYNNKRLKETGVKKGELNKTLQQMAYDFLHEIL
jgi:ABC-type methionine transport system ATPase subunit